jgi:uncharacterized protein (TIRG00374 family)
LHNGRPKPPIKKIATGILRAALVIAPLAWIYSSTSAGDLIGILKSVSVPLLLSIAALTFANIVLQGVKWWMLIRRFVPGLRLGKAVGVHIESVFYSIALPTAVAQDIVKSVILSKSHDPSVVWAASWLGRLIGLLSLLLYSAAGLIYLKSDILPPGFRETLIAVIAAVALLCALSFSKRLTRPILAISEKIIGAKITGKLERLRNGIYQFKYARGTLLQTFFISAVIQFLIICAASLCVYAVSGEFYLVECIAFVPLAEIIAISLPLTPSGVGVREALMALMFMRLGFDEGQIASYVTISLLMATVRVAGGAPVIFRMIAKAKK